MMTIDSSTTVRELVTAFPATFDVLLRHGMCPDCQADPPPVRLGHFAEKHCNGDVSGLLAELKGAAGPAIQIRPD